MSVPAYRLNKIERMNDLRELAERSVWLFSDKPAFLTRTGTNKYISVTYREFGDDFKALGTWLIDNGFLNKRVAILGENSYPWLVVYFSVIGINSVVVPLDKDLPKEELVSLIERAGADALFYSSSYQEEAQFIEQETKRQVLYVKMTEGGQVSAELRQMIDQGSALLQSGDKRFEQIKIDRESLCSICFTSGTTGRSKGVMLSHKNLISDSTCGVEHVKLTPEDTALSVLPVSHTFEDSCGIFGPMYWGVTIAFCDGLKNLPECLSLFRPTYMVLVPLYLETFLKRIFSTAEKQGKLKKLKLGFKIVGFFQKFGIDLSAKLMKDVRHFFGGRLNTVICGGAYMNPELYWQYKRLGITIIQGYGITECSPIVSANLTTYQKYNSCGRVASCNQVKFDADGQLLVKGDNVMMGYLDDPKATEEAFEDGWFKTGDLGFTDKKNLLYISGRMKNLIVLKNGKNIMPDEIESQLMQSAVIQEVMVTEAPDEESLMAYIYPNPELVAGMAPEEVNALVQSEVDKINSRLPYYKKVHSFKIRETEFPKTTSRKIKRYKL